MLEKILIAPYITEKSTALSQKNQYLFRVEKRANKNEVKKVIENLYKVKVIDVKIINVPAKRRRLGRISGWKKGFKKAIVRIKEGQKIEILPR
jgi:large subunit ribosomal protein L23